MYESHNKPVRLIGFILLVMTLFFFYGCKNNNDIELRIKKRECIDRVIENRELIETLTHEFKNKTNKIDAILLKNCLYVDSLRSVYSNSLSRKDLLIYADSIVSRYRKIDNPDIQVLSDWESLRKRFDAADSSGVLNFYYLTLLTEKELLHSYAVDVLIERFIPVITSYMSKDHFMLNDTITVLARVELINSKLWDFDFNKVVCINTTTGKSLSPRIVKVGPHYIFYYQPTERGTYTVDGKAHVSVYGDWETDARIHHEFVVE